MNDKELFEQAYEKPDAVVWTNKEIPEQLIKLIETGKIRPGKALDVGCGEGYHSIYLAKKGFEVTGIDLSEKAIEYAKSNAKKVGVNIKFIAMDATNLEKLNEKFDFVLGWGFLHCIPSKKRKKYVEEIQNLLNPKGKYLSISFNEKDEKFGGSSQGERVVPKGSKAIIGTKIYFASLEELKELFSPYFRIIESKIFKKMRGGKLNVWNYFFMEKK
ncbi:MAG: methyltransferase domain-containing protein [archaeon]|nr:MAG: methyltransferase domain-containing protein [archaeon]